MEENKDNKPKENDKESFFNKIIFWLKINALLSLGIIIMIFLFMVLQR